MVLTSGCALMTACSISAASSTTVTRPAVSLMAPNGVTAPGTTPSVSIIRSAEPNEKRPVAPSRRCSDFSSIAASSSAVTRNIEEIPAALAEQAAEYREKFLETLAEADDAIMEKYLEGEDISVEELEAAIRRATLADKVNPVLCGTAFKNKGVQPLLDAVVKYLPSPLDIDGIQGHDAKDEERSSSGRRTTSRSPAWPTRSRPTRTSAS